MAVLLVEREYPAREMPVAKGVLTTQQMLRRTAPVRRAGNESAIAWGAYRIGEVGGGSA